MIPDGFGDPITSFENPYRHADRDTPYLTHTPSSFGGSSCRPALAFASRAHRIFWDNGREVTVFIPFRKNCLLVHGLGPVRVLGHGHGPVLGVVVWVGLDWRFGWTCGAPRDDPPLHTR